MAHLRDAHLDAPVAGIRVLGRVDPPNPFPSRHRRNRLPEVADLWGGSRQSSPQIRRHVGLWPLFDGLDVDRSGVTGADPSDPLQAFIYVHPVAAIPVGL